MRRLVVFGGFAILANVAIVVAVRQAHSPAVVAAACADLLITLPAVYYLLVVRPGVQPASTMVPVLLGGLLRASYLVPFGEAPKIIAAVGCETGILWFLIRRGRKSLAVRVLLSELDVFRMALVSWWMKPDVPEGGRPFTMHKQSGTAMMFVVLAGMSLVEGACVHLVLRHWSPRLAWWSSGFSLYGALLLVAVARSFTLRPIVVLRRSVLIRAGLLWSIEVPFENIAAIETATAPFPRRNEPGYLRITGLGDPNLLVTLRESVAAEGLYGRSKIVSRIGISADRPAELLTSIHASI